MKMFYTCLCLWNVEFICANWTGLQVMESMSMREETLGKPAENSP